MKLFYAAMALSTLLMTACQSLKNSESETRVSAQLPSLSRVNLFGGTSEKGYFFKVDLEQKSLEGNWTELDPQSKEFVSLDSSVVLTDAQLKSFKDKLRSLKEVDDSNNDCGSEASSTHNLLLSDSDDDLLFEAVGPEDSPCGGPFIEKSGYLELQKQLDAWLPVETRKRAAPAVANPEVEAPKAAKERTDAETQGSTRTLP